MILLPIGLALAQAPARESDARQAELLRLREMGANGPTAQVAKRRALNAQDPLPFLLGDTLGIADLHAHVLAEEGFDHRIVVSSPAPCDGRWHGLRYDVTKIVSKLPEILGDPTVGDLLRHCPQDDYPTWRSFSHEQYAMGDLRAAHAEGLDLIVVAGVNNILLCGVASDYSPDMDDPFHIWWGEHPKYAQCSDDVNVHRQLAAAWVAEAQEPDLVEVVLSPGQTNHAMAAGRQAWVLGIEAGDYLGPEPYGGIAGPLLRPERDPVATARQVARRLADLGVTMVIGAHEWDNAVGGSALQHTTLFQPGYALVRRWKREDEWATPLLLEQLLLFRGEYDKGRYSEWPMGATRYDLDNPGSRTAESRQFMINRAGLTAYGKALMHELLVESRLAMVDVTHLSERSIRDLAGVLEGEADPEREPVAKRALWTDAGAPRPARVIASHGPVRSVSRTGQDLLEYPIGDETYAWVLRSGGVISSLPGAYSYQTSPRSPVDNTCPGSSRSYAQGYHWLAQLSPFVAVGTDMNGAAIEAVPRRGPYGCIVDVPPARAAGFRKLECLREAGRPGTSPDGDRSYARNGLSSIRYLPQLLTDVDQLARNDHGTEDASDWMTTDGSWWTAQRFVDDWVGGGRAQVDVTAPTLADKDWLVREPTTVTVDAQAMTDCEIPAAGIPAEGIHVRPRGLTPPQYEVTVDSWSGDYPAWYLAAVEEVGNAAALSSELRSRGLGVTVDEHGDYVTAPLTAKERAEARLRASDECSPTDTKPVAR